MPKRKVQAEIEAKTYMDDKVLVRLHPKLKQILDAEATRLDVLGGMGGLAAQIIAEYFQWDQAQMPPKRSGRRSKARLLGEPVSTVSG